MSDKIFKSKAGNTTVTLSLQQRRTIALRHFTGSMTLVTKCFGDFDLSGTAISRDNVDRELRFIEPRIQHVGRALRYFEDEAKVIEDEVKVSEYFVIPSDYYVDAPKEQGVIYDGSTKVGHVCDAVGMISVFLDASYWPDDKRDERVGPQYMGDFHSFSSWQATGSFEHLTCNGTKTTKGN